MAASSKAKPAARVIARKVTAKKPVAKASSKTAHKAVPAAKIAPQLAASAASKAGKTTTAVKAVLTPTKVKIVRDSFTMTEADHELIKSCKKNAVSKGRETRKSEVVRAAIIAFSAWPIDQQIAAYQKLLAVKTGRPSKAK
jgi:hypothetical protein